MPNSWSAFSPSTTVTPLPKRLTFASERKFIELAARGHADPSLEGRTALQRAIAIGRGGFYLNLTDEQYQRLK
jgi:hypothetical protein